MYSVQLINTSIHHWQGFWVLCQNCHLSIDYMNELVNFIQDSQSPHPNFRIWITTEPHPHFPISLLQLSIKFTYEPPQGKLRILFDHFIYKSSRRRKRTEVQLRIL